MGWLPVPLPEMSVPDDLQLADQVLGPLSQRDGARGQGMAAEAAKGNHRRKRLWCEDSGMPAQWALKVSSPSGLPRATSAAVQEYG